MASASLRTSRASPCSKRQESNPPSSRRWWTCCRWGNLNSCHGLVYFYRVERERDTDEKTDSKSFYGIIFKDWLFLARESYDFVV